MLKAVIFDMDGVLVDSEPVHFAADYKMMKDNFGIKLDYEDYKGFIGSTLEKIWKFYREKYELYDYEWNELMDKAEAIVMDIVEKDGYEPVEGAARTVKELKEAGYKLAVASSSPMAKIDMNLKTLGLTQCFDKKVSGMELNRPKPNPDIFLKAAELLGVESSECIVIEDSHNGVLAAKAAGMACLGFINPNSGNQDLSAADYLFEDFHSINAHFMTMVHSHRFGIPWKVMETDRLIIREICPSDIDALMEMYDDEEVRLYVDRLGSREEELANIKEYADKIYGFYEYGMWILQTRDDKVIGRAGVEFYDKGIENENYITGHIGNSNENTEGYHLLGYIINKKYRNKGYAYEACSAILEYMQKEVELDNIYVNIHKDNKASISLAKKLGFLMKE